MSRKTYKLDRTTGQTIFAHSMQDVLDVLASFEARTDNTYWSAKNDSSYLHEWFGGMTFSQAVNAITNGWNDAPEIKNLVLPRVETLVETTEYFHDVTGNEFDAPAYFAGSHECFIDSFQEIQRSNKIIKLAIEIGGSARVAAAALRNRGEAIIALINSLEIAGYSVELLVVNATITKKSVRFVDLIPVKEAGQALDMRRVQFIFTPAFYRRCLFALEESFLNESVTDAVTFSDNYKPEGYTHIPYHAGVAERLEDSLEWAEAFASALVDIVATETAA